MNVNLKGAFLCTQTFMTAMVNKSMVELLMYPPSGASQVPPVRLYIQQPKVD